MVVKICGLTNLADALAAAGHGADFVGLVRVPGPRQVAPETARQIAAALPTTTTPVLVFRNSPASDILAEIERTGIACVQLHGGEPVSCLLEINRHFPTVRLIKAWEVCGPQSGADLCAYLDQASAAAAPIHAVLLDTPKRGPHPGPAALAAVARRCRSHARQIWCAGGLTPDSVAQIVGTGAYDGVDVARGVEASPGRKDHAAIERFFRAARS
jgi:phosphoribosylanthranilate isomerase